MRVCGGRASAQTREYKKSDWSMQKTTYNQKHENKRYDETTDSEQILASSKWREKSKRPKYLSLVTQ
jgi:hypothetical protein